MPDSKKAKTQRIKDLARLRKRVTELESLAAKQTKTKHDLVTSENRNRALIEAIPDAILRIDKNGYYIDVNVPKEFKLFHPPHLLIGKRIQDVLPPDLANWEIQQIRSTIETGQLSTTEYELTIDGERRYRESRMVKISDSEAIVILRDITQRKKAEEELRQSEARFRRVITSISDHVYMTRLTPDGSYKNLYVAPSFSTLTGYALEKFLSDWSFWPNHVIHPQDKNIAATQAKRLSEAKNSEIEYRIVLANGDVLWIRDSARTEVDSEGTVIYGIISDITASKKLQTEITQLYHVTQQRTKQLAVLYELDRALSASLNLDDIYRSFAQHTNRLLPYDRMSIALLEETLFHIVYTAGIVEPAIGSTFPLEGSTSGQVVKTQQPQLYKNPTDLNAIKDITWAAGVQSIMILPLLVKQQSMGTWNIGSCRANRYTEEDLELAQAMADQLAIGIENAQLYQQAQREIAERKQAQDALETERALLTHRVEERTAEIRDANIQLARAARLKDEFLASMSHELRTPLNAILGMSEALLEQVYGSLTDKQMKSLNIIEESGRHLLLLINEILDLAKIGAGELNLEISLVVVEDICQASLRIIKQTAYKKEIKISYKFDQKIMYFQADHRRVKQILVNLLSNAVKFTDKGGTIGLEVETDVDNALLHFTVWDTGIGIAPDQIDHLFDPFVQLDNRLAREYEGTGLGLSLVHQLVTLHEGKITVDSQPGQGSRFTVTFPTDRQFDPTLPTSK
ncbi:MAG: PAS domain S-box protein [Anaerolineae bacterium]|nr:PAS domain S-box protein [Anaerolineae bacterium]